MRHLIGTTIALATLALVGAPAAFSAPPANNAFSESQLLTGASASHSVSTLEATTEPGEPDTEATGGVTANTVWYHWQAASAGTLSVSTACGFTANVYTGSTLAALAGVGPVGSDGCATKYPVAAGTVYRIQVGHNMMFGGPGTLNLSIAYANEFRLLVNDGGDGTGAVTSNPSGIECNLQCRTDSHVYAGGTSVTLTANPASTSSFTGWSGNGCAGASPTCTVTMNETRTITATFTRVAGPANDAFASAQVAGNGVFAGSTIDATLEENEPDDSGLIAKTVWYKYTPSSSGILRVATCTADFSVGAAVFTGSSIGTLVRKTASVFYGCPSGAGYSVTAGTPYYIQVAGTWGEFGTFQLGLQLVSSFPVHLTKTGTGSGAITSSPAGINCGFTCSAENAVYPAAQVVTLTAAPASPSSTFAGWTGACAGSTTQTTCQLTMDDTKTVGATFTRTMDPPGDDFADRVPLQTGTEVSTSNVDATMEAGEPGQNDTSTGATLWYQWTPSGRGTVTISTCGSAIAAVANVFTGAAVASLTPVSTTETSCTGGGNGSLKSWRVAQGQGPFHVQVGGYFGAVGSLRLLATFVADRELTLTKTGSGTVSSTPAGISCGSGCLSASELFAANSTVTLTATPEPSTRLVGWSGACSGSAATCQVTMDAVKEVTATFAVKTYELQVTKAGTGFGTVTSTGPGIDCGGDCGQTYDHGTDVVLTAAPASGSTFGGWSGACSGSGPTCSVSMVDARSVTATFVLNTYALTVQGAGSGSGTISSVPAGINCGADCSETFGHGTAVALTATPAPGSTFAGWSGGGCSGTGPCAVSVTAAQTVLATFTANPPPPVTCKVPALKGKTLAQAKVALTKANCALGKVTKAFSTRARKGKVLKQSPGAGAVRPKGTKVAVTLGKGPRR